MYGLGLLLHSFTRWIVLALGLAVCLRTTAAALRGWPWGHGDDRLHSAFIAAIDLQFLLGLVLYGLLSPLPASFLEDMAAGMKVPTLRFFILDHPVSMFIAIALIHIARDASKRRGADRRHALIASTTWIALAIILAAIPWPGLRYGRPLLRPLGE